MPQVQNSSDVMELKGLRRKVPTELGPEVTKKLGGPAKAAEIFFNWTRGCGEIPELKAILAAHKANPEVHHKRQLTIVRYFVGGPGVLTAEDLARQDDELASKTDGFVLTSDLFRKAHLKLVDVLRDAGCSQDVVEAAAQRVQEIYDGYTYSRAHPVKKPLCSCCSVQ